MRVVMAQLFAVLLVAACGQEPGSVRVCVTNDECTQDEECIIEAGDVEGACELREENRPQPAR